MKVKTFLLGAVVLLGVALAVTAQSQFTAWKVDDVVKGNQDTKDFGILNEFRVNYPITITALGAFDSESDGFKGSGAVVVQLFQRQGSGEKGSLLLETATFDAASPGELNGCFRIKPLARPVTLLPGNYTITGTGFDKQNKVYNFTQPPSETSFRPTMTLNNGAGAIQFLGCNRFHGSDPTDNSDQAKNLGGPERFAAMTFVYARAQAYATPFAADYAALTAGVANFPIDAGKSNVHGGEVTLNRYGSIALLNEFCFPIVMEPSGNRMIFEAAGYHAGAGNSARCVVFAHEQWGHAPGDGRMTLFENAVRWAGRKSNPGEITIGLADNLNSTHFLGRGFQVRSVDANMKSNDVNTMTGCDVIVVDFHGDYTERFFTRLKEFAANGGGVVATFLPWRYVHGGVRPKFTRVNDVLAPFGMAYRTSLTQVGDYGFTNIQATPYPPLLFNGFPAADLLRQDKLGQLQLTSLEKAIAMHTVAYAADRQPERLAALSAVYSGSSGGAVPPVALPGNFADVSALSGAQAIRRVGKWMQDGADLVSVDSRGSVEYGFTVAAADVYRIKLAGSQDNPRRQAGTFDLKIWLDDQPLGQFNLGAVPGVTSEVELLTPFCPAGAHTLRVLWDNAYARNRLRLSGVHIQSAYGADSNGNGIKDWVESLVDSQSGLSFTNSVVASYVSPFCLEGSDPYPGLIVANVSGADANTAALRAVPAPNGTWFMNVPLASDGETSVTVNYQNGVKTDARRLVWLPVNVLAGGSYTIRRGDSLSLVAKPAVAGPKDGGSMQFTVGTNHFPIRKASFQMPHQFDAPGTVVVSGTYSSNGVGQTGSITVKVVEHSLTNQPDAWVGFDREWDVFLPAGAALAWDDRMFATQIAPLPGGGWRNSLLIDKSEPRYFVSRLGTNGPVLGAGAAKGFNFWHGRHTYTKVIQKYTDGSQLVEMMLVLSPTLSDLTLQLDVIVGGVVFEDGTISKQLTAANFDAQGRCIVRFIRPASAKTSVCHSITIKQGNTVIGVVL